MKQFLIIGNMNAITYKEVFPLIKNNRIWLGVHNGAKAYYKPDGTTQKFGNTCWFTNAEHGKRHQPLKTIAKECVVYQKYDNYDAIEVSRTSAIPNDYDGVMGVPLTFLEKHNPEQFEIIWQASGNTRASAPKEILDRVGYCAHPGDKGGAAVIEGARVYSRILIQRQKEAYQKYDNYDAIEVSRTSTIPSDYDGVMGVPISFLDKYCPEQFEIVGASESEGKGFSAGLWDKSSNIAQPVVNAEKIYKRIFIKHRKEV